MPLPAGFHWDDELRLGRETAELTARVWPNYLVEPSDLPEPGLKFEISVEEFRRRFPAWGIRRDTGGELVAFANAVRIAVDEASTELPDAGWRFAIESAGSRDAPNCLCLVVANVDPSVRGLGFARSLIERAKLAARELGYATLVAPVRPTRKHEHPHVSMAEYVSRRNAAGEPSDPWLQTHVGCGAEILNVCDESVLVSATVRKWEEWTGVGAERLAGLIPPGALAPLTVDSERGVALYREPNVWVRYALG